MVYKGAVDGEPTRQQQGNVIGIKINFGKICATMQLLIQNYFVGRLQCKIHHRAEKEYYSVL